MKTMQKTLSFLLSILLFVSLLPASAMAAEYDNSERSEKDPETVTEIVTVSEAETPFETDIPSEAETETAPEQETEAEGQSPTAVEDTLETVIFTEKPAEGEAASEPEETAETEEAAETVDPAETEEEILSVSPQAEYYASGALEGDEELLDLFAQQKLDSLYPPKPKMMFKAARDPAASLTGINRAVYVLLKPEIAAVANGEKSSTVFTIPVNSLGLEKTSWTASELGVDSLTERTADGKLTFSKAAMEAVNAQLGFELRRVINSLQNACPYELYWYDKTAGTALQSYSFSGNSSHIDISGSMSFTFAVSEAYSDGSTVSIGGKSYRCGVNGSFGQRVNAAVERAASIVAMFAAAGDLEKLRGYKNSICDAVSYDDAAIRQNEAYGDPWQLISVFDGDPATNVVCEGYSKAFQYLCDLTSFSGSVTAWCVTGTMSGGTGAGSHMWNLVRMENGKLYLVDVTNCDTGSVGYPDRLFLAGCAGGSTTDGYTYTISGRQVRYVYDSKTLSGFSAEELTVSDSPYIAAARTPGLVKTLDELKEDIANGVSSILYTGTGSFPVNEDVTIPAGTRFELPGGTLSVGSGAVLTVASGGTVLAGNAAVAGSLRVSGTLRLTGTSNPLSVTGAMSVNAGGAVYIADPTFRRSAGMKTGGGYYYVEHEAGDEAALRSACEIAAGDADGAVLHRIYPRAAISLSADLSLPKNSRVIAESGCAILPQAGVTLTNSGKLTVYQSFTAPGRIVNQDVLTLAKNVVMQVSGGYKGTGILRISKDSADPFASIPDMAPAAFDAQRGADGYWNLTLRQLALSFDANGGSGAPAELTGSYGDSLRIPDTAPQKSGFAFLGWATAADASEAAYQPGDELTLTGSLTLYALWRESDASFAYADSVTFKGELKLNFYLQLSEQIQQDKGAYVLITANGKDTKVLLSDARRSSVGDVQCHVFSLPVVAKEMRDQATLRLFHGNGTAAPLYVKSVNVTDTGYTSSVMAYLTKAQQTSSNPKMVALAKAAENYGTAAQIYFDYKAGGLSLAPEVSSVTDGQLAAFAPVYLSEKNKGISVHSASVMFKSDNALRQYFTLGDGENISSYSFTIDGKASAPTASSQNRWYVALPNIAAKDLDTEHLYSVSKGSETYSFRYSPLSYAYQILRSSTNDSMKDLARALYLYNQAANAYFG